MNIITASDQTKLSSLLAWLDEHSPYLERHAPETVASLQADRRRLEGLLKRSDQVTVCVLGSSGVGKSTLLNAMVGGHRVILPAGGTGPLTASATIVEFCASPFIEVTYHSRQILNGVRLALETELRRRGTPVPHIVTDMEDFLPLEVPPAEVPPQEQAEFERISTDRLSALIKQATQVVRGDQYAQVSLPVLIAGMRRVLQQDDTNLPRLEAEDAARCAEAATALRNGAQGQPIRHAGSVDDTKMLRTLRAHAAGSLAPLVAEIRVGWPSAFLEAGLILVDLPGVGVAGDRYRDITAHYVRDRARAVMLVVDKSGPKESDVELLRTSGYWERLLVSAGDPDGDRCAVLVAVTKLDDEARLLRQQSAESPKPSLGRVFSELLEESLPRMRAQAAASLGSLAASAATNGSVKEMAAAAKEAVLNTLRVLPVAAPQYAYLKDDDDEQRPFVRSEEETGVPELARTLTALAIENRASLALAQAVVGGRLLRSIHAALDQIEIRWTGDARAIEEVERLRAAMNTFLQPLRIRLADSRGVYRGFLNDTATYQIDQLVEKASAEALVAMEIYLNHLQNLSWSTLRAAVVRGGVHLYGRTGPLDVPSDLATLFQEPMAAIWGKTLLRVIRKKTADHARDARELVEEVCSWADREAGTRVQHQVLASQLAKARDREIRLAEVGAEAIAELKAVVLNRLAEHITGPIRSACEVFVEERRHIGPGTKYRITDLLTRLASDAAKRAQGPAERLLRGRFEEVRNEISREFEDWGDPLEGAAEAITEREHARQARSDTQRRANVLTTLKQARDNLPEFAGQTGNTAE